MTFDSRQRRVLSAMAVTTAMALAACSDTTPPAAGPSSSLGLAATTGDEPPHAPVWTYVCKQGGTPGTFYPFSYNVQSTVSWSADVDSPFTLTPGDCSVIFVVNGSTPPVGDPLSTVTVTEDGTAPVDSIWVVLTGEPIITLYNTRTVTVQVNWSKGGLIKYWNGSAPPPPPPPPPPPGNGQGCTPGYWKQSQHFDSWSSPYVAKGTGATDFDAAFGVNAFTPNKSLLKALGLNGGGLNALARHAAAGLLNSASDGVDYGLTTAQVIALVQAAISSGDYESAKNTLEALNERGCSLN